LIDQSVKPVLAVEFYGSGPALSSEEADRIQVKRLVLVRLEIPLINIRVDVARHGVLCMIDAALVEDASVASSAALPDVCVE
jgi:hypothetical protein